MKLVSRRSISLFLMLVLGMLSGTCPADSRIVVVVSSKAPVQQLSKQQVSDYFLGENLKSSPLSTPFDRNNLVLKESFYHQVAGMSLNRLRAFWAKKVFTSRGRPPRTINPDMIDDTGVFGHDFITYMYEDELTDLFKVVYTLGADMKEDQ